MDRNEAKLRERLARAKGGHRRVLQRRLDAMTAGRTTVEAPAPPPPPPAKKSKAKKAAKKD